MCPEITQTLKETLIHSTRISKPSPCPLTATQTFTSPSAISPGFFIPHRHFPRYKTVLIPRHHASSKLQIHISSPPASTISLIRAVTEKLQIMTPPPTAKRPTADHFALNAQCTQLLLAESRVANTRQHPGTEESEAAYAEAVAEIKKQQQEVLEQLNKVQKGDKRWNVYEGAGEDAYSARITEQAKTKKTDTEKDVTR